MMICQIVALELIFVRLVIHLFRPLLHRSRLLGFHLDLALIPNVLPQRPAMAIEDFVKAQHSAGIAMRWKRVSVEGTVRVQEMVLQDLEREWEKAREEQK